MPVLLNITIWLPLITGLVALLIPSQRLKLVHFTGLLGALIMLFIALVLSFQYGAHSSGLAFRTTLPWIPALNASYDVAVDGLSLPLIALTCLLLVTIMVYTFSRSDRPKAHTFLFLLMTTGLNGLFASQDLLLFYVFFEVSLVPLYFIIGIWGHENRGYAAMKFFLYTRLGSLAMLLSFLGLYLSVQPHTFSLAHIAEAHPFAAGGTQAVLILLGLMLGFGVKLPIVPLHNWLPDAHVEAPTEGSVILAGALLKMGGYGMLRIMITTIPEAVREAGWVLVTIAVVSIVYGALAALGQTDFKRLVAYTSINHMGFVLLGATIATMTADVRVRDLAFTGATFQMVSHGLLTGGMFFMVGILQETAHTRDMNRLGGLIGRFPLYSFILAALAFGSLGLPGLSGFVAEFQVIGATLSLSLIAALFTIFGLLINTGVYLKVIAKLLMGSAPDDMPAMANQARGQLFIAAGLAALSVLFGIAPMLLVSLIRGANEMMAML
jgi:NADH-quinone oxidoreductase subunit M